jgi:hypothetical protein
MDREGRQDRTGHDFWKSKIAKDIGVSVFKFKNVSN